jgi:integrase
MYDETRVWISSRKCRGKPTYHLRWIDYATGKWRSKAAGTDRKFAEREAARLEESLAKGTHKDLRKATWAEFTSEHVAKLERTPATVADVKRTLKDFGEACNPRRPRDVTFRMIESFVAHLREKGNSIATRQKRLRYLRAAFGKAVKRNYMATNPMAGWEWTREEEKIPRALTVDEKTKLLAACPSEQWRTFVTVALTTGCRRGELLGLTWDRVDFDFAQIVVTATKAHRDRVQPLSPEAVTALRDLQASTLKDGGPFRSMNVNTMSAQFGAIRKAAGIGPCTIHDLRRTFCTDLLRVGVNQLVVQKLAGHASAATTARYYQFIDDGTKRDALARLTRSAG